MDEPVHDEQKRTLHVLLLSLLLCVGGLIPGRIAAQTNTPSFEAASIRPSNPDSRNHDLMWRPGGRLDAINISPAGLILDAYDIDSNQLVGLPSWARSTMYTIRAVAPAEVGQLPAREMIIADRQMLQSLLADRFKLKVRHATKELPIYELVVAKGGAKLSAVTEADLAPGSSYRLDHPLAGGIQSGPGLIIGSGMRMSDLASSLAGPSGRLVVDRTGLSGRYDFKLTWTPSPGAESGPDLGANSGGNPRGATPADVEPSGPSFFTALQEQLGLKLKSVKGAVDVLVVDHIETPTPN
jgi:bla regulator protein blaR1